ncbi:hypothetical protein DCAR_0100935 [Daucus carota subsp. sativus]|uniref:Uncharacterized protein n=1 Tax=Daucus carota subsp. sativus TaxID=79200 RepID=A0A166G1C8_DAUCS|nr:hypothetical protein DCAR_0100935 [Daucus carota subsp. sativus]
MADGFNLPSRKRNKENNSDSSFSGIRGYAGGRALDSFLQKRAENIKKSRPNPPGFAPVEGSLQNRSGGTSSWSNRSPLSTVDHNSPQAFVMGTTTKGATLCSRLLFRAFCSNLTPMYTEHSNGNHGHDINSHLTSIGSERTPVGSTVPNMTAGHVNDTQKPAENIKKSMTIHPGFAPVEGSLQNISGSERTPVGSTGPNIAAGHVNDAQERAPSTLSYRLDGGIKKSKTPLSNIDLNISAGHVSGTKERDQSRRGRGPSIEKVLNQRRKASLTGRRGRGPSIETIYKHVDFSGIFNSSTLSTAVPDTAFADSNYSAFGGKNLEHLFEEVVDEPMEQAVMHDREYFEPYILDSLFIYKI